MSSMSTIWNWNIYFSFIKYKKLGSGWIFLDHDYWGKNVVAQWFVIAHYCYKSYYTHEEISNVLYLNCYIVSSNILHEHSINFREGGWILCCTYIFQQDEWCHFFIKLCHNEHYDHHRYVLNPVRYICQYSQYRRFGGVIKVLWEVVIGSGIKVYTLIYITFKVFYKKISTLS